MESENKNVNVEEIRKKNKNEEGFSNSFDKLPNWLRWLIALPASIVGYTILYFVAYIGWYWYAGDIFTQGFIGQTIRDIMFVAVPLYIIHECVPKHKFIISVVLAGIYTFLGISVFAIALYTRPIDMGLDYFFVEMLPGIITTIASVLMIVVFVKHRFNLED